MKLRAALALLAVVLSGGGPQAQEADGVRVLLSRLERILQTGDGVAYMNGLADSANRDRARDFIGSELLPGAKRAVIQERDRQALAGTLAGNGYQLIVDAFAEFGSRARAATWRVAAKRTGQPGTERGRAIAHAGRLS